MGLLAVQGTLKSLLQHNSEASILQHSVFFIVQLSHPYMTTGKTIVLTRRTFVGKVMSLFFNMLSRLVITFLPRSKRLLISYAEYLMRNAGLEEEQPGINIAGRNINNLRYADDTTLMAESDELKSLLMKVRGEWKSWLKAQHSEN